MNQTKEKNDQKEYEKLVEEQNNYLNERIKCQESRKIYYSTNEKWAFKKFSIYYFSGKVLMDF